MNPLLLLAAFGSRPKVQQTVTFSANTTWVAPADVNLLTSVVGHGANGSPAGVQAVSVSVVNVSYVTGLSGGSPAANDWSNLQPAVASALSAVNAGGSGSFTALTLFKYSDGTEDLTGVAQDFSGARVGSASANYDSGWHTEGAITNSGGALIAYNRDVAATTGASATGFGFTFAGGVGGAAATNSHPNVAVTPLASYNVVVPAGATVQITYYQ